jgi:uncharacterized protein YndB with AHSA1/START domain
MAHKVDCTLILRRSYNASVERVWRAWTDANELAQWYVAGDDHVVHFAEANVQVGGSYRVGFAPPGEIPFVEEGRYLEVVPKRKLVFEEKVSREGKQLFLQVTTVELFENGGRTDVTITCTGVDTWRTGEGWTPALESLAKYLGET